jgi:hypothetical protein
MSGPIWQAILLENIMVMLRETEAEERLRRGKEGTKRRGGPLVDGITGLGWDGGDVECWTWLIWGF